MPRNYNNGQYRSVGIRGWQLSYGFTSRIDSQYYDNLGQEPIDASTPNLVIGCNSPKPGRATLKRGGILGSVSSFYNTAGTTDKTKALQDAGWKVSSPQPGRLGAVTDVSTSFYVTIEGVKYAFQSTVLPSGSFPADLLTATGLKPVTDNDQCVWGCSYPKPPIAKKETPDGLFKTFADPQKKGTAAPAGWIIRGGRYGENFIRKYFTPA